MELVKWSGNGTLIYLGEVHFLVHILRVLVDAGQVPVGVDDIHFGPQLADAFHQPLERLGRVFRRGVARRVLAFLLQLRHLVPVIQRCIEKALTHSFVRVVKLNKKQVHFSWFGADQAEQHVNSINEQKILKTVLNKPFISQLR